MKSSIHIFIYTHTHPSLKKKNQSVPIQPEDPADTYKHTNLYKAVSMSIKTVLPTSGSVHSLGEVNNKEIYNTKGFQGECGQFYTSIYNLAVQRSRELG